MNNNSFGLSAETLAAIVKVVASVGNVQRALIYGSRAKGTFRPNSDVDIMLEGDALTISDLSSSRNGSMTFFSRGGSMSAHAIE